MTHAFRTFALPALIAAALLIQPAAAAAQQRFADTPPNTLDIMNNSGGNVVEAIQRRSQLERYPGLIRIRGYCRSACTIYLTMKNACLGDRASVGFHAPRLPDTNIIPPLVGDLMGQFYRGEIRRRWYADWQYSLNMHRMSAAEYKRLDPQVRLCGSVRR